MKKRHLFICGGAIGAFVGFMVGMSASPVVASVVSALIGLVTAYCTATLGGGLHEAIKRTPKAERHEPTVDAHIYLAGFSACGLVAVFGGLYIRTHNALSPTPKQIVEQWTAAGFTSAQAQQVALNAYETSVDILPRLARPGPTAEPKAEAPAPSAGPSRTVEPSEPAGHRSGGGEERKAEPRKAEEAAPRDGAPHHGTTVSVLINADVSKCDSILGPMLREQWELAERAIQRAGGEWPKVAEVQAKTADDRHAKMKELAEAICRKDAGHP